ncbi:hypothetical protein [Haloarcula salinisoli]|nr:hypothetical protein [Halomicroarcula salinisoli]
MSSDSQSIDESVPALTDDHDIEADHRRAQESSAVFEGRRYGGR